MLGQSRNWNRLDNEEGRRQDLEDDLERERRMVSDLDMRLLQMETEKMELNHQLKVAKQKGNSLESHLIFLEEQLAAQLVHSDQKQMSPIFLEEQLPSQLVNVDEELARQLQLDGETNQQDEAAPKHEKLTLIELKPEQLVKWTDMETQTEPEKEESHHPLTLLEDDLPNDIVIDHILGVVTEQIWVAGLKTLFQELLVHLIV